MLTCMDILLWDLLFPQQLLSLIYSFEGIVSHVHCIRLI
ncbi:hypothetical protein GLYMA_13G137850v4 [Glycine max]|nr:hypothetical protein GLYMA_13G137850v4 [Glycine max]KAH1101413.1 hypothetical protein GYH30_036128 [Glycine max]